MRKKWVPPPGYNVIQRQDGRYQPVMERDGVWVPMGDPTGHYTGVVSYVKHWQAVRFILRDLKARQEATDAES